MAGARARVRRNQGQAKAGAIDANSLSVVADREGTVKKNDVLAESVATGPPKKILTAAGAEVEVPHIEGDGIAEIRQMRGQILRSNITKALEGSHLHMKVLFEYAGLWPAGGAQEAKNTDDFSLAALLLEKLEEGRTREEGR